MEKLDSLVQELKEILGNDYTVDFNSTDSSFELKIVKNENENEILKAIKSYKDNLDLLDDCLFLEVMDDLKEYNINLKKFDDLLSQEEFTEDEEECVLYLISLVNSLITKRINNKIQELNNLKNKF
jgi:hypothetical protein